METILIFRKLSPDEVIQLNQKLLESECLIVQSSPTAIPDHFSNTKVLPLPADIMLRAAQKLLKSILALGDKNIGESTIGRMLDTGNFPLWHYQRFRIFFALRPLFVIKEAIDHYIQGSTRVICYCDFAQTDDLNDYGSRLDIIGSPPVAKPARNYRALINYSVYFLVRVLIGFIFRPGLKNRKHLLVDRSPKQRCRHLVTLEPKSDNYNLSPLFDLSGDDFLIVSETEPPKTSGNGVFRLTRQHFSGLGRRSKTIFGEYILFRGLISFRVRKKRKLMLEGLNMTISELGKLEFTKNEGLIFNAFVQLAPTNLYFITKSLAYGRFFEQHSFDTVTAIDENSPSTRCILDPARKTGAIAIGIQHGNIGEAQPAYLYTETDAINRVMADYTLVWGDYWKEFLETRGNFHPGSVIITGQMRTDIIPKLLNRGPDFKRDYHPDKSLVVFASQPIPDPAHRKQAALDVFSAFRHMPDARLIVKLHPGEREAAGYYSAIAAEAGCNDFLLVYEADLYELIADCDLLITCYSTVGTEAVYFGKPLIILDHQREDLLGYMAEGVAWQATDASSLESYIRAVLSGKLKPDPLAYRNFIKKYASDIDGKATERVLSFIRGLKSHNAG